MSDIIVKFKPSGQKQLIDAINKLQKATGKHTTIINKNTKATNKNKNSQKGLLKSQRLVSGSFATMRSHLLLYSFAMSLGIILHTQYNHLLLVLVVNLVLCLIILVL